MSGMRQCAAGTGCGAPWAAGERHSAPAGAELDFEPAPASAASSIAYDRTWLPALFARLLGALPADDDDELVAALVQVYDGANAAAHIDHSKPARGPPGTPPSFCWPPDGRPRTGRGLLPIRATDPELAGVLLAEDAGFFQTREKGA
ncbi:hypothetical protein [Streptomyces lydicus]|uniref:hypothetical protein n=1 Tax=Streptomyces lydicus TaxID=47763 RepID=UPI0037A162E1